MTGLIISTRGVECIQNFSLKNLMGRFHVTDHAYIEDSLLELTKNIRM
jgi:hypothetical protein